MEQSPRDPDSLETPFRRSAHPTQCGTARSLGTALHEARLSKSKQLLKRSSEDLRSQPNPTIVVPTKTLLKLAAPKPVRPSII